MNKSTILCCEDNKEVAMMVSVVLEDLPGVTVANVGNGQEALDYLRAYPETGLLILDLRMPKKAGVEFLQEHQNDPVIKNVPVVLLSGDITLSDVAKQFGIEHYIEKGCGPQKFLNTIRSILKKSGAIA